MTISEILKSKSMSVYRLAKESSVPYTTCSDLVSGRAQLEKCSAETVYKIAHALDVSMEDILAPCFLKRSSFDNFRSNICHRVKESGDIGFIRDTLESDDIRKYYEQKWYPESLYLLAMLDYISRENNVPICSEYDDIRRCRLEKTVYPSGILAIYALTQNENVLERAAADAIPEFKRFNIIENEVRNVI